MDTWLKVALNGPWSRAKQPGIPISADEIVEDAVACAGEGAAIVHFHAYDVATGRQRDAYEIYAPIIERIRARSDAICYPTLPLTASVGEMTAARRFEAVERLAEAGLIEWTVLDTGTTHIVTLAQIAEGRDGFVYANADADMRRGMALATTHRLTPSFAIYEPGFLRTGAALARAHPAAPRPIYRFMFSEQFTFGLPPTEWALDAYLRLLQAEDAAAPWMIAGLGVELERLMPSAIEQGGHVRVGLEDAPLGCRSSNRTLVARAVAAIGDAGRTIASASTIRNASRPAPAARPRAHAA